MPIRSCISGAVAWVPTAAHVVAVSMSDGRTLSTLDTPDIFRFTTPAHRRGLLLVGWAGMVRAFGG